MVFVGEMFLDVPVTVPIPEIEREVALETDQERVDDWPDWIVEGEAEKEEMVGGVGAGA